MDPTLANYQVMAWKADGSVVLSRGVAARTWSLSGKTDGDVFVPELGEQAVYLRIGPDGSAFLTRGLGPSDEKLTLELGKPVPFGDLTWMLMRGVEHPVAGATAADAQAPSYASFLSDLVLWISRPMSGTQELRDGLREFLSLIVDNTPAASGMLVLAEGEGFSLVSSFGLTPKDAQKLWEKMPHSLTEEVMRTSARVLLPDELRRSMTADSTVFVRGVRSVAGFPVLAEGRLLAIFYLGFDNLMKSLSQELQHVLEAAADILGIVIQRALLREQLENLKLRASSSPEASLPSGRLMVGSSEKLVNVYHLISRLSPVDVSTLILGETGTGKELAAKELHRMSPRGRRPFVVVNAAALPESLIESELFGHKKGAFTGALTDRIGLVEQAEGGTLFIDEIGELPPAMQAKLLRVLQERALTRIGETTPRQVDFRLVSATHRNLEEMVQAGTFREDLYYRIAGAVIRMPALRERPEDIITLANFFRRQFAERHGLSDKEWSTEALIELEQRPWPGNVRELENVVGRAFVMAEGSVIRRNDLGGGVETSPGSVSEQAEPQTLMLEPLTEARDAWMKGFLMRALKRFNGRRAETAKALGIGERTLFRYLEQYEIRDI